MKSKRILSIILVFVMVFAMAATACGKKEEAAEKEEPKQEETSDEEEADEEDESSDGVMKTGDDDITEEDFESLKDSIRDTVISEYLEPNNISAEEFEWPDIGDESWEYFITSKEYLAVYVDSGVEMSIAEPTTQNQKLMKAVLNGITSWLDSQGSYDIGYFNNTMRELKPYNAIIPTIDFSAK